MGKNGWAVRMMGFKKYLSDLSDLSDLSEETEFAKLKKQSKDKKEIEKGIIKRVNKKFGAPEDEEEEKGSKEASKDDSEDPEVECDPKKEKCKKMKVS